MIFLYIFGGIFHNIFGGIFHNIFGEIFPSIFGGILQNIFGHLIPLKIKQFGKTSDWIPFLSLKKKFLTLSQVFFSQKSPNQGMHFYQAFEIMKIFAVF
jgi:hypothetical protein